MRSIKRTVVVASVLAVVSLSAGPAEAQGWLNRPLSSLRPFPGFRSPAGGMLAGGEVVGTGSFAADRQPPATLSAAQYQDLVTAQARQTPTISAAQWQQLVTAQVRQPVAPTLAPAQQANALRAAAAQHQHNALMEALRELRQQQNPAPPPPPHP